MADVNKEIYKIVVLFSQLDYSDREDALKKLKKYQDDISGRQDFMESLQKEAKIVLGPTGTGGCPCCGR